MINKKEVLMEALLMKQSLKVWCEENQRSDILEEYDGILGEYTKYTSINEILISSKKNVKWKCKTCGSYKTLTVKERISIQKIECLKCKRNASLDKRLGMLQSTDQNMAYLSKTIQSSIPEQFLFYYLKKVYVNVENQKKFSWLGNMSLDIYLTDYNVAVEYDGARFHLNRESDKLKFDLCKENGVKLIRVVEKSHQEDRKQVEDWYYSYSPSKNYENIIEVITNVINYIGNDLNKFFDSTSVNLKADLKDIKAHISKEFNKRTLFYKWSELAAYWDYERNGMIMPNHIFKSDNKIYYLKCPKCDYRYSFKPLKRRSAIPACICERDRYASREEELMIAYNQTHVITFNDDLLDRQIEDSILLTASGLYDCYRYLGSTEIYQLGSCKFSKDFLIDYLNQFTKKKIDIR